MVTKERNRPLVKVVVPADDWFFLDPELGIPHRSRAEVFGLWLDRQIKGGR